MHLPLVETQFYTYGSAEQPVRLRHGKTLPEVTLAYECMGQLNEDKSNAILLFHALSGSQHFAGFNPEVKGVEDYWNEECQVGWWTDLVGPGKAIDTNRFFVVCANFLGGCYGSSGPCSINPETGKKYGGSFPSVTLSDIVDSQAKLLDHLGIDHLHAVVGGSVGGILANVFAGRYPDRVKIVVPIAAAIKTTSLQRIFNLEQIFAIESDPYFNAGHYYDGPRPLKGLALARMIAHKNYVSLDMLKDRARKEVIQPDEGFDFYKFKYPLESYMLHQGQKFVERFDANSYLRIVDAWQCFEFPQEVGMDTIDEVYDQCRHQRYMVYSIDTDVCFYPEEQARHVQILREHQVPCRRITIHSPKGHDAFLLEPALMAPHLKHSLETDW